MSNLKDNVVYQKMVERIPTFRTRVNKTVSFPQFGSSYRDGQVTGALLCGVEVSPSS